MEISEFLNTVNDMHAEARRRHLFFQQCEAVNANREVVIGNQTQISFSSCSYLGLERHPALVAGVIEAVNKYGTQFSSSRGYLSAPGYEQLESNLSELFDGYALVVPSTTLGHQIILPAMLTEKDAIVLDHQAHHSVHMATTLARANGTHVEIVKHGELARAVERVRDLSKRKRNVWFACDGVYSMFGDLVPIDLLTDILAVGDNVRLYVDDAHGMSWAGKHGSGSFLSRMPRKNIGRIIVTTSLNKAFSAAGGCIVFQHAHEREQVQQTGAPMVFSGPIQPPMLGAALASSRLHLSDEIYQHQTNLRERVMLTNQLLVDAKLPLLANNESPIFFIRLGLPRIAFAVAECLKAEGLFVNVSVYPAVPMKRAGIRLSITSDHRQGDIRRVVDALGEYVPLVMARENFSQDELDSMFANATPTMRTATAPRTDSLSVTIDVTDSITTIPNGHRETWDSLFGHIGASSWNALQMAERCFSAEQLLPEHRWKFRYATTVDQRSDVVAATYFTTAIGKDDMLMREEVSQAVEARRGADPYFLTSKVVMTGSLLSEGHHFFVERHADWQPVASALLDVGFKLYEEECAGMLVIREMPADDPEMDAFMLDRGFVKCPALDSHHLEITWANESELAARLDKKKRRYLEEQIELEKYYDIEHDVFDPRLHSLYANVARRKRKLNVFELPENMIEHMVSSPAWDVVSLRLRNSDDPREEGKLVAFFAAHVNGEHYAPFLCGLDYDYVHEHGAYRQALFQMIKQARLRGCRHVHLGMDADTEKRRYDTTIRKNCVYVHVRDHYNAHVLHEIVAGLGVGKSSIPEGWLGKGPIHGSIPRICSSR